MNQISDKERSKIQSEAREILEKFGKSLESIKTIPRKKIDQKLSLGFREDSQSHEEITDPDFRKRILANSPKHNEDSVIAEKKQW